MGLLIISLGYIPFGLETQCNDNTNDVWTALIDNY